MTSFNTLQEVVAALATHGVKPALIEFKKETIQSYSFTDLADLVQRLGRGLVNAGFAPGDKVLLFAPNRVEWILACLALIYAGAVPVPVDMQIGQDELQQILEECRARWAFTTPPLARRLEEAGSRLNHILLDAEMGDGRNWRSYLADSSDALSSVAPDDLAILFYTSFIPPGHRAGRKGCR